ncbi:ABC transporter permease [Paracnuella aquatica]|nr:ABC transporter permease [Paracnuella aquatica]
MQMQQERVQWNWVIKPETSWLGASFKELLQYRDLLSRMVRKEFLLRYQQTLLGPVWVVIQPLLTMAIYLVVFNKVIGLSTLGVPPVLFYLTGINLWNLFSDIFNGTSGTFVANANVFSKVYFPRLIIPLSVVALHLLRFAIQMGFLILFYLYFFATDRIEFSGLQVLYIIPAVITVSGIALGSGLIFSILTAKYRDLSNMIGIINSLLMFVCPVFYSLSIVPEKVKWLVDINPLSGQFELFRLAILGKGMVGTGQVLYGIAFMVVILLSGILFFNKTGDRLMDVV